MLGARGASPMGGNVNAASEDACKHSLEERSTKKEGIHTTEVPRGATRRRDPRTGTSLVACIGGGKRRAGERGGGF